MIISVFKPGFASPHVFSFILQVSDVISSNSYFAKFYTKETFAEHYGINTRLSTVINVFSNFCSTF